jgi:hypothetical protein
VGFTVEAHPPASPVASRISVVDQSFAEQILNVADRIAIQPENLKIRKLVQRLNIRNRLYLRLSIFRSC